MPKNCGKRHGNEKKIKKSRTNLLRSAFDFFIKMLEILRGHKFCKAAKKI